MRLFNLSLVCISLLVAAECLPVAVGQETPRSEFFLGYSYLNADLNDLTSRQSAHGGDFSVVVNLNRWIGTESNFSAYYKSVPLGPGTSASFRDFTVGVGPRLHYKWAYAHALFGLNDLGASVFGLSDTNSAFATSLGGGAVFRLTRLFGLEAGADYALTRHNVLGGRPFTQNNFRAIAGVVFNFGHVGDGGVVIASEHEPQLHQPRMSAGLQIASLGLLVAPRDDNKGAEVTEIAPNSVAAMTGLHAGDIINSLNGTQVRTPMELATMVSEVPAGSKTEIGYLLRGMWQSQAVVIMPSN